MNFRDIGVAAILAGAIGLPCASAAETPTAPLATTRAVLGDGAKSCSGRTAESVNADLDHAKAAEPETCGFTSSDPGLLQDVQVCSSQLGGSSKTTASARAAGCLALINSGTISSRQMAAAYVALSGAVLGDKTRALADADSAIAWDPNLSLVWSNSCERRLWGGEPERALQDCSRAIELDPNLPDAWAYRGDIHLSQRRFEPAISDYDKAIQLKPDWMWPWTDRGAADLAVGKLDDAKRDFDKVVQLSPDRWIGYANRGEVEILQKDFAAAASDFDKALAVEPACGSCMYGRAIVKVFQGDQTGASELAKAQQIDPRAAGEYASDGITPPKTN